MQSRHSWASDHFRLQGNGRKAYLLINYYYLASREMDSSVQDHRCDLGHFGSADVSEAFYDVDV
jgi:hypothetical protein